MLPSLIHRVSSSAACRKTLMAAATRRVLSLSAPKAAAAAATASSRRFSSMPDYDEYDTDHGEYDGYQPNTAQTQQQKDIAAPKGVYDFGTDQTTEQHTHSHESDVKPYQGAFHSEALPEIFIQDALEEDERLWVPQTDKISFRPLCLSVSGGYYTNLLRVKGAGLLSRHRHPGPIHAHVLKGSWKYLEHEWEAKEGSYIFEPPGDIHTLIVPEGVEEMITLFHVTGAVMYCDENGDVNGYDDVFTKLELAKQHYADMNFDDGFINQFLR